MAATSLAVAGYQRLRKRSMAAPGSESGRSLDALIQAASYPPEILNRIAIVQEDSVTLYIFRVPGKRDLCLSFYRPGADVVTDVDVTSAVYYCRFDGDTCTLLRRDTRTGGYQEVALLMDPPGHVDVYEVAYAKIEKRYWSLTEQDQFSPLSNYGCYIHERDGMLNFMSPWTGQCEMTPSKMGGSLKCHHILTHLEGEALLRRLQVSELRFNFQATRSKMPAHVLQMTQANAFPLIRAGSSVVASHVRSFAEDPRVVKQRQAVAEHLRSGSSVVVSQFQNISEDAKAKKRQLLNNGGDAVQSPPAISTPMISSPSALRTSVDSGKFMRQSMDSHLSVETSRSSNQFSDTSDALRSKHQSPESPFSARVKQLSLDSSMSGNLSSRNSRLSYHILESPGTISTVPKLGDDSHDFALHSHPPPKHSVSGPVMGPRPIGSRSNNSSVLISSPESDASSNSNASKPFSPSEDTYTSFGNSLPSLQFSLPNDFTSPKASKPRQSPDLLELPTTTAPNPLQSASAYSNTSIRRKPVPGHLTSSNRPKSRSEPQPYNPRSTSNKENAPPVVSPNQSLVAPSYPQAPPTPSRRARPSTTSRPNSMFIPDQQANHVVQDEARKSVDEQRESLREHHDPHRRPDRGQSISNGNNPPAPSVYRMPFLTPSAAEDGDDRSRPHSRSPSLLPIPDLYPDNGSPSPPPRNSLPEPPISLGNLQLPPPTTAHETEAQPPAIPFPTTTNASGDQSLDLTLGREKLGGGFDGEQAKLGKLIIEAEGQRMLDLIVGVNVLAFTRAARFAGVWA